MGGEAVTGKGGEAFEVQGSKVQSSTKSRGENEFVVRRWAGKKKSVVIAT
jgi:ribosomal protein L36